MAQVKATSIALYLVRVFDVLLAVLDYQRPSADQFQLLVDLSVPSVVPMIGSLLPPIYVAYRTLRISYRFLLLFSTLQSPHRSSVPLTGSLSA